MIFTTLTIYHLFLYYRCSILLNDEIANAGTIFQQKWDLFLDNVIAQSY